MRKKYLINRLILQSRPCTDTVLYWLHCAAYGLLLVLLALPASAQFIRINITIPEKTGISEMEPFAMKQQPDSISGNLELEGTYKLAISSAENFLVLATLTHSDSLRNEQGSAIKLSAAMTFRNDGNSKHPGRHTGNLVVFPMSDSGLLIENMRGLPPVLNAYIFIDVSSGLPTYSNSTFTGNINITIEYN